VSDLPEHVRVTDETIRHIHATCRHCEAQADIGQYDDPGRTDEVLAEWVERHRHGEP